jgi:hypothetical protein
LELQEGECIKKLVKKLDESGQNFSDASCLCPAEDNTDVSQQSF